MSKITSSNFLIIQTLLAFVLGGYGTYYAFVNMEIIFQIISILILISFIFLVTRMPVSVDDVGDEIIVKQFLGKKSFS